MTQLPVYVSRLFQKTVHVSLAEDLMSHYQKYVEKLCKAEQVEHGDRLRERTPSSGQSVYVHASGLCVGSGCRCRC